MSEPIYFYFDFASPYAYLASRHIDGIAEKYDRSVAWRPMMLGAALKIVGTLPLTQYPLKGDYMMHDLQRRSRAEGISIKLPPGFPHATLAPARAFYWIADDDEILAKKFALEFFNAYLGRGENVSSAESAAKIASTVGLKGDKVLDAVQEPIIKQRLKVETELALERGVFGSPFVFIDDEPFWGSDRLDEIDRWLHTGGW